MNDSKVLLAMIIMIVIIIAIIVYITSKNIGLVSNKEVGDIYMEKAKYIKINPSEMLEEIKNISKDQYVILDVRTKEEYYEERVPNSVLLTLDEIESKADTVLPNKDVKIYVYCRSGKRSQSAAYKLIDLGYKHVYDIGGIIDYPYEKIKSL